MSECVKRVLYAERRMRGCLQRAVILNRFAHRHTYIYAGMTMSKTMIERLKSQKGERQMMLTVHLFSYNILTERRGIHDAAFCP